MSDDKDKPQTQTTSVDGFHAFGNPLDNTDAPIKHRKKQLPIEYRTRNIENDLGDGGPDFVQVTAITMQYDIMVSAHLPVEHSDLLRIVANAMIYARLSDQGYQTDNIELVDAGENKEGVELKIDFNPVLRSVTDGSFAAHQFHGFGNVIEEPIPRFEDYESFLSFLESIRGNPYDNVPVLRNYITRLYYHNDMPVLNKGDLVGSCNRCCTVLSELDTAKYIDKLIEINFLVITSEKPTHTFQSDCLDGSSLYLNIDFYNPDSFCKNKEGE